MVAGRALLARWVPRKALERDRIAFSAVGVGTIVFVPLAQYLVAHYDWRFAYRFLGAVILVLAPSLPSPCVEAVLRGAATTREAARPRRGLDAARGAALTALLGSLPGVLSAPPPQCSP